ncbi:MAG: rhomboid family intramembrane serine protease [Glaciecola sp.]|jgi:membrane associated rhomboid family serine protease|nr:rhomboid family intramembrane serine protease [Glaciecola sp.]MDG1815875.1 rhomboid family intramembrane serine protease [Glaciecola sp.]MDG2098245.1 rhomboid family intramembrane serine protease [Glaciecola sp.]
MKLLKTRPDWHYLVLVSAILFVIEIINVLSGRWLNQFSIVPRDITSLPYIITAPWLHISIAHFGSNFVTLVILSFLLLEFGLKRYVLVSLLLIVSTGVFVWTFGRTGHHLGASGIVYGYFGYLVLAGWLSKRIWLALISVGVVFFYGGLIWGVLPTQPYISWESHLFGFVSGLFFAYKLRNHK